jgi:hypothetical protein
MTIAETQMELLTAKVDYLTRLVEALVKAISEEGAVAPEHDPIVHSIDTGLD